MLQPAKFTITGASALRNEMGSHRMHCIQFGPQDHIKEKPAEAGFYRVSTASLAATHSADTEHRH